jgi:hypothetical protein
MELPALEMQILESLLADWEATPAGKQGLRYMHGIGLGNLSHEEKLLRLRTSINKVEELIAYFPRRSFLLFTPFTLMNHTEFSKYLDKTMDLELQSSKKAGRRLKTKFRIAHHHEGFSICSLGGILCPCWK